MYRGALAVGRDVAEGSGAGSFDSADGRFGSAPDGYRGGFWGLGPGAVEEEGGRARVGVCVLGDVGLEALAEGFMEGFRGIGKVLGGCGDEWPVGYCPGAVGMGAGEFAGIGFPSGCVDFCVWVVVVFLVEIQRELGGGTRATFPPYLRVCFVNVETCPEAEIEILSRWGTEDCLLRYSLTMLIVEL